MTSKAADTPVTDTDGSGHRPRIALMGEFSAGKSTLLNMLLGQDPLPVRITATSVPPVWISYGDDAALLVERDGTEHPMDIADLEEASLQDTKFVRLWLRSEILELCDLFDMPGISDPNMSRGMWEDAFAEVESVIWCTHATQAWRQSEAALWDDIADKTNGENLLVITQFDKIGSDRDRARLLARVRKEIGAAFRGVFPIALLDATNAQTEEAWRASGAGAFVEHLIEMMVNGAPHERTAPSAAEDAAGARVFTLPEAGATTPAHTEASGKVMPKRVATNPRGRTPRARPADAEAANVTYALSINADR